MKVALYYPWIYLTSGAERILLELSGRSRHEWTLFTNHYEPDSTFPGLRSRRIVELDRISVKRTPAATFRSAFRVARQRLPLEGYDALVIVCEGIGDFAVFRNRSQPILNICLTPLRIVFDPVYRARYERHHGFLHRILVGCGARAFGMAMRNAWKSYDRVFCISQECLSRVRAGRLGRPGNQEVLHIGIGFAPNAPSDRFERFFLAAGRIMWTKNIELAIGAFREFVRRSPESADFELVIAGIVDEKSRPYLARLQGLAQGDPRIHFRIFPSDEELAKLYGECYGVLFTPFNEDWGIVPVEAMAFGKPVIAVKRGGPLETVVHGVTGFLEAPEEEAFARRMSQLASDPDLARRMGYAGHLHSQRFSWDEFVGRIDREIEILASGQPAAPQRNGTAVACGSAEVRS
jgi:glycosyltransferase involved in cell wall biosynthesis